MQRNHFYLVGTPNGIFSDPGTENIQMDLEQIEQLEQDTGNPQVKTEKFPPKITQLE